MRFLSKNKKTKGKVFFCLFYWRFTTVTERVSTSELAIFDPRPSEKPFFRHLVKNQCWLSCVFAFEKTRAKRVPYLPLLLLLGYRELPIKVIEPIFERSEKRESLCILALNLFLLIFLYFSLLFARNCP